MNGESILSEFGTFDVENYGDLLYPVLFKRMFQKRDKMREIQAFSFMGSESLEGSGYDTRPIRDLLSSRSGQPRMLIIGGGDLLRTDWNRVASHYDSSRLRHKEPPLPFTFGLLLRRLLHRRMNAARKFRYWYMNYPAVGPFIIDPASFSGIKSVAYCSCGVPFPFDDRVKHRVASAANKSVFLYVRDRQSKDALIRAGVSREIHVGPDLIVVLSDFFDAAMERKKGQDILEKKGVDIQRNILCVQSNPQTPENNVELVKQLTAYQKRTNCEVVLLPLARCHGDHGYLQKLVPDSGGAFKYIEPGSIFESVSLLAACDVFLGTSLHGNITAFSFGIPHLFGPIAVAKTEGFLDAVNLPLELKLKSWAEVNEKLATVAGMDREAFVARVFAAKQRVHEIFDLLIRAVTSE